MPDRASPLASLFLSFIMLAIEFTKFVKSVADSLRKSPKPLLNIDKESSFIAIVKFEVMVERFSILADIVPPVVSFNPFCKASIIKAAPSVVFPKSAILSLVRPSSFLNIGYTAIP